MGRRRNRDFWESGILNNATFIQYYNRLVELAISRFEWINLPDTVDSRFLELTLFTDGCAIFFEDEEMGYLALQSTLQGRLNQYRIPIDRRAYAVNGYNRQLTEKDSVLIFNNMLHTNSLLDVQMFAKRLYELDRVIDINAKAQKTPILILCDESERLTMENLYMKYDGNMPVIKGQSGLNVGGFTVLKTDAPYVARDIYELKTQYWNEALTYLGITNVNITKKERLVRDEVQRNQGGTIASRFSAEHERQEACKKINEMFGLELECRFREEFLEGETDFNINETESGVQNV